MAERENYAVTFFVDRQGWGLTFRCDLENESALLRDFPWLRSVRDGFVQGPLKPAGRQPHDT
jgi:hypothetical protein